MLQSLYDRLKGRGNTLNMKMILHVGGNDMYGRTMVTELLYCLDIPEIRNAFVPKFHRDFSHNRE